jgi:hypothetical protein
MINLRLKKKAKNKASNKNKFNKILDQMIILKEDWFLRKYSRKELTISKR